MDKQIDEINVIPLVDIMLVLLTIVLVTATFVVTGQIEVNLPDAKNVEARALTPLVITITKDEMIYINDRNVIKRDVHNILKNLDNKQAVIIKADEGIPLREFAFVMDILRSCGFKKVSMEVKAK